MKKGIVYLIVFIIFILGIIIGVRISNRYEIAMSGQGVVAVRIDKLTGKVNYVVLTSKNKIWGEVAKLR